MSLDRRDVLRFGATAAAAATVPLGLGEPASAAPRGPSGAGDHARIVAAYRELQVGVGRPSLRRDRAVAALDKVALAYDAAMDVTGDQLWADLPTGPGSTYFPTMYYRLRTIAVDWATPGSALSGRPGLPERLVTALTTLYRTQYNEGTPEMGNWYSYEIGVPYWLLQIVVALGDHLPAADRERVLRPVLRFVADPNHRTNTPGLVETGANRADKALITVVSGALAQDPARVAAGLAAVTDVAGHGAADLTRRSTEGDGYRTDGSFIQHEVVPYPGHYGLVLLSAIAALTHVTAATGTQLPPPVREMFEAAVTEVYAPFLFAGSMMEPVRGRMLSRQGETGHDAGHQFIAAVVLLARTAAEPARSRLASLAARWIDEGTWAPYLDVADLGRYSGGLQPVGVPEVEFAERLTSAPRAVTAAAVREHRVFPQMDRMVHTTPGWSASLGTGSRRICRYESINGMNLHGWYTGDGVLYTFLPGRQGHYSDAYWPTVDATLLPGTTEKDATPPTLLPDPPRTTTAYAGGVRFDDAHGAHGLDFVSQDGTLSARKSWFFTPDAVICLGAAITDASGAPVRTAIENRNLGERGAARLLVDGRPDRALPGTPVAVPDARWLHLEGTAGYVLLDGPRRQPLTLLREDRTGSWLGIDTGANTHGTAERYTRRYQKIVLDHGVRPAAASYAYAVLPGASADRTRRACGRWHVLANTEKVQSARLDGQLTAASFFTAGGVERVRVSGAAAMMWGRTAHGWTFALSDPTQTQDTVRVTVEGAGHRVRHADPSVTVVATHPRLVVDIEVAGSFGGTHTFTTA
ncbi:polysaccharide lyase 8 family protein [Streptomyces sp. ASQP_92]|uniref:polysaccharide lyase 8 family protein n=1 Tax=Streptomyces sp. ASQP_92 TaxID=2979116 RepID=UPI0021C04C35|nr:polysaccharide lyase 8 family protein [Streptomyces sp. ASQP_92]MCT9088497.1 polysaccharide lyase 8 family protein [Streptomyces sp. ASQP_92]